MRGAALAVAVGCIGVAVSSWSAPGSAAPAGAGKVCSARRCPAEMAEVDGFCIDRWEVHTVDVATGARLSPHYPPEPKLLAFVHDYWTVEAPRVGSQRARALPLPPLPDVQRGAFSPRAVSAPGELPQGYFTYFSAKRACENAGKRLCSEAEWTQACRSRGGTKHPYSDHFEPGRCNVFRNMHPAYELHGNSSLGHLDPRLGLVWEEGTKPLLLTTGQLPGCVSMTRQDGAVYDMVGNLDEWIEDPEGTFLGGFFSRSTRDGCEAKIDGHAAIYTDYSLGTRCCAAPQAATPCTSTGSTAPAKAGSGASSRTGSSAKGG
ncbi:MAG TPA: SUMF1/EgtB/PvdO family nonheme iron enzyme [Polyangiaceae bacterium]|nr:SUMF1/EgtB/PvdO family nonheme iron enzyme [Polyangiaceae bacterium]